MSPPRGAVSPAGPSAWTPLAATALGSSHGPDGTNQDSYHVETLTDRDGRRVLVAAVADGHGGRRYTRSQIGSDTAARLVAQVLDDALGSDLAAGQSLGTLLPQVMPRFVPAWRDAVRAHAQTHPFAADELATVGLTTGSDPSVAYGSTLLVAAVRGDEAAFAQIGDGDIVVRDSTGTVTTPVPGDARLVANETTSLCLPSAVDDFRYASCALTGASDLILLASDGYGNAFASDEWRGEVMTDLAHLVQEQGSTPVAANLPQWLAESATVGGDDVTVVLLVHQPDPSSPVAAAPAAGAAPTSAAAPAKRRGKAVLAILLAAIAVIAAATAFALRGGSAPAQPTTPTVSPSRTSASPTPTPSPSSSAPTPTPTSDSPAPTDSAAPSGSPDPTDTSRIQPSAGISGAAGT